MNWIEELDDILAIVEDTVKGSEGDMITKARGIIQEQRKGSGQFDAIVNGRPINVYDLVTHLRHQKEWSATVFGPADKVNRTEGIFDHMKKEIEEARDKPQDIEEWIDIAMLAFDGAWRNGATPEEIAGVLFGKLQKNRNREWPDWTKADPNKAIEHNGH